MHLRRLRFALTLVAALAFPALATGSAEPAGNGIAWEKDFKAAMRRARESGKPVLVDFWADWCHWCHKLDQTTYRDTAVVGLAGAFVPVKVNAEGSSAEVELTTKYGVQTLPTIGFVSPGGRLFLRRTGYEEPEQFRATLREAQGFASQVAAFEEALGRQPKDPAALAGLGGLLADLTLLSESLDLLRAARKVDSARPVPERKRTRRALARAERARGKAADAEKLLQEALALQPADAEEDAAALFVLGETYLDRGRPEQARDAWQRSLKVSPEGPVAGQASQALAGLPAR
jgi:thioredoxin-like negative regulator of GroEL